jgi:hypothetical protein
MAANAKPSMGTGRSKLPTFWELVDSTIPPLTAPYSCLACIGAWWGGGAESSSGAALRRQNVRR